MAQEWQWYADSRHYKVREKHDERDPVVKLYIDGKLRVGSEVYEKC